MTLSSPEIGAASGTSTNHQLADISERSCHAAKGEEKKKKKKKEKKQNGSKGDSFLP